MSDTQALVDRAKALLMKGDLVGAENACRQALATNPFSPHATAMLGAVADAAGNKPAALDLLQNAVSMDGSVAEFRNSLGIVLKSLGRRAEAEAAYEKALELDPDFSPAVFNLAILHREEGRLDEALELNRRAAELEPDDARAHNNLGTVLYTLGYYEEAAESLKTAIRLDPSHAAAHGNYAGALAETDDPEQALRIIKKAKKKWPKQPDILNGACNAYMRLNRWDEALRAANETLAVDPEFAQAHYAKGWILLAQGRYEDGWPDYEWRDRRSGFWPRRQHVTAAWNGEPLNDKTLLVHWEQGFGDILQFVRYLPLVRQLIDGDPQHNGARVVFDCPRPLISLLEPMAEADEIDDFGDKLPEHDFHVLMLGLPKIFGTTTDTIPRNIPYIHSVSRATSDLPVCGAEDLKVGLTWTSDHRDSYRRKVVSVDQMAQWFDQPGISFYGLQVAAEAEDLAPYEDQSNVFNLGRDLKDFADTAAVADQLDLVICIDTALAHLAGAMGRKTWVMLPYSADWRWGIDGEDAPWYPTLKLFRQPAPGDWQPVINAITAALSAKAANT